MSIDTVYYQMNYFILSAFTCHHSARTHALTLEFLENVFTHFKRTNYISFFFFFFFGSDFNFNFILNLRSREFLKF